MPKRPKQKKLGPWFQCDLCGDILSKEAAVEVSVITASGRGSRRDVCRSCEKRHARLLK